MFHGAGAVQITGHGQELLPPTAASPISRYKYALLFGIVHCSDQRYFPCTKLHRLSDLIGSFGVWLVRPPFRWTCRSPSRFFVSMAGTTAYGTPKRHWVPLACLQVGKGWCCWNLIRPSSGCNASSALPDTPPTVKGILICAAMRFAHLVFSAVHWWRYIEAPVNRHPVRCICRHAPPGHRHHGWLSHRKLIPFDTVRWRL